MGKSILVITILFVVTFFISSQCNAYHIARRDSMNLTVKVDITFNSETKEYIYTYTIINNKDSSLDLEEITFEYEGELSSVSMPANSHGLALTAKMPMERYGLTEFFSPLSPNGKNNITWATFSDDRLKPNSTRSGHIMSAKGIPGIVTFYARGFALDSNFESNDPEEPADNPELMNIFANSLQGKTLGPVLSPILPPAVLDPVLFTDVIVGYTNEALQLGWISDITVANGINDKLNSAKGNVDVDNKKALEILQSLLADLETQHGKSMNDDAYLLIKINVTHLKDNIK